MLSNRERRLLPRFSVDCPIKYFYLPPSPHPPETSVVNLSMLGACILAPDPLILGSVIAFQIITAERKVVDARARVIHVESKPNAFFRVGVQFLALSEDARTLIARELELAQQRKTISEVTHDAYSQPSQAKIFAA
ncbi:MAG: PilZ domain-containing protein [Chloroflexota bacterium]